jgi:hypothetical protein
VLDLKRISANSLSNKSIDKEKKARWKRLLDTIESIEAVYKDTSIYRERFKNYYEESCSLADKDEIAALLYRLFELSLYMRGWDGKKKWPIEDKDIPKFTNEDYESTLIEANARAFKHLKSFREAAKKSPFGDYILNLPLVRMFNGKYSLSLEFQNGATIGDRIVIIEDDMVLNGCLGMSSNWILSSSYFYLEAIDRQPPNCNIKNLKMVTESVERRMS